MITIFTTAKPFIGKTSIQQINALKSWKLLSPSIEIILFGDGEGYPEIANELGLIHISEVQTSDRGTPLVNSMFTLAEVYGKYPIKAYVNCDIILMEDFLKAIQAIRMNRFLMIGQRWDMNVDNPIDFNNSDWQLDLRKRLSQYGVIHPPGGSDYFIYKGNVWGNLPDLIVGRVGYDNVLIYKCRFGQIPVIDGTSSIIAVHQNHDYSFHTEGIGVKEGEEAQLNFKSLETQQFRFTPLDADWRLFSNRLGRNFCRGDYERYIEGNIFIRKNKWVQLILRGLLYLIRFTKRRFVNLT